MPLYELYNIVKSTKNIWSTFFFKFFFSATAHKSQSFCPNENKTSMISPYMISNQKVSQSSKWKHFNMFSCRPMVISLYYIILMGILVKRNDFNNLVKYLIAL